MFLDLFDIRVMRVTRFREGCVDPAGGFVYSHQWEEGDLVLWDNLRTIHTATPFDAASHPREMWRTTVAARPPVATAHSDGGDVDTGEDSDRDTA